MSQCEHTSPFIYQLDDRVLIAIGLIIRHGHNRVMMCTSILQQKGNLSLGDMCCKALQFFRYDGKQNFLPKLIFKTPHGYRVSFSYLEFSIKF